MGTVVNDLVTKFSFAGSTDPLTGYNAELGSSIKLLGGMMIAVNAVSVGIFAWADSVLTGVDAMSLLSKQTGISASKIQELGFIAEQNQSSLEAMSSTLQSLTGTIGTAAQKGSDDFSRLGISVRDASGKVKTADKILDEVRKRFIALNLSMQEQEHFASALGIDSSLLQVMGKTDTQMAELSKRARELGTLTAEQVEQSDLYRKSLKAMEFGLGSVKQLIAVGLAPEMEAMSSSFITLLEDNKDWIVNGIKITVKWIGNLIDASIRLTPVLAIAAVGFVAAKTATLGFAGAMALVLSPVVLITAGIVALGLIIDDLIVAFSGGKSVIAGFFKDAFDIDIVSGMTSAIGFLNDGMDVFIGGLKAAWDLWEDLVFGIINKGAEIASVFGIGADESQSISGKSLAFDIPPAGVSNDNRQVNQSNTINITTNDPEAAGRAVDGSLQRQLDNADTQLSTGGL